MLRRLVAYSIVGHAPCNELTRGLKNNGKLSDVSEMVIKKLHGIEGSEAFLVRHAMSNEDFAAVPAQQEGQTGGHRR